MRALAFEVLTLENKKLRTKLEELRTRLEAGKLKVGQLDSRVAEVEQQPRTPAVCRADHGFLGGTGQETQTFTQTMAMNHLLTNFCAVLS